MGRKNAATERSAVGGASEPAPRPRVARVAARGARRTRVARPELSGRGRGGAAAGNGAGGGANQRSGETCAAGREEPPTQPGHTGCGESAVVGKPSARRVGIHQELHGVGFPGKAGGAISVPCGGGKAAVAAAHHKLAISTHSADRSEGSKAGTASERDCATHESARGSWAVARASHTVWTGISPAHGRHPREPSAVSISVRELPQPPPHTSSGSAQVVVRSTHCAQTTSHRPTEYHSSDGESAPAQPHSSQWKRRHWEPAASAAPREGAAPQTSCWAARSARR